MSQKEIKREIQNILEENRNGNTNIITGDGAKVVPSGKFATTTLIKKSKILNRKTKLTPQETKREEKAKPKVSRAKIRARN